MSYAQPVPVRYEGGPLDGDINQYDYHEDDVRRGRHWQGPMIECSEFLPDRLRGVTDQGLDITSPGNRYDRSDHLAAPANPLFRQPPSVGVSTDLGS